MNLTLTYVHVENCLLKLHSIYAYVKNLSLVFFLLQAFKDTFSVFYPAQRFDISVLLVLCALFAVIAIRKKGFKWFWIHLTFATNQRNVPWIDKASYSDFWGQVVRCQNAMAFAVSSSVSLRPEDFTGRLGESWVSRFFCNSYLLLMLKNISLLMRLIKVWFTVSFGSEYGGDMKVLVLIQILHTLYIHFCELANSIFQIFVWCPWVGVDIYGYGLCLFSNSTSRIGVSVHTDPEQIELIV